MKQSSNPRESHDRDRRRVSAGLLSMAAAFAATRAGAAEPARDIVQPPVPTPEAFMARAEAMRQQAADSGDQAYGAVVVKAGRIVGEGPSQVVSHQDPTAHAEVEAIRDAARRLGTRDLSDCELYATSRPCPMCATAAYWARIARVYVGADIKDTGPPRYGGC
ncbi:MAG: nucleoside deaminase [Alphaproteobacteria bacterium]|nr:nucleoside deaminase [Alphaproteobacteria bacterium]